MVKKINHRGHRGHRALLFICGLCGYKPFQEIIKSLENNKDERWDGSMKITRIRGGMIV